MELETIAWAGGICLILLLAPYLLAGVVALTAAVGVVVVPVALGACYLISWPFSAVAAALRKRRTRKMLEERFGPKR